MFCFYNKLIMKAFLYLLFLIIFIINSKFEAIIIFKDDFTGNYTKNWIALGAGEIGCKKIFDRSTCITVNEINVRTINGTLVLTAIQEKYFDRFLTSASLISKQKFKIDPEFNYLFRTRLAHPNEIALTGQIILHHEPNYQIPDFDMVHHPVLNSSYEFQIYDMIFENYTATWRINDIDYASKSFQPFHSSIFHPFNLQISLRIKDKKFRNISENLTCSSLIIDFIELHKLNGSSSIDDPTKSKLSAQEICNIVNLSRDKTRIMPMEMNYLELVWSDEFEGNSFKQDNWYFQKEKHCRKDACYDNYGPLNDPDDLVEVSNGTLKIMPKRLNISNTNPVPLFPTLNSYLISKRCFQNVRIEIRAKRPRQTDSYDMGSKLEAFGNKDGCNSSKKTGFIGIAQMRWSGEKSWPQELDNQNLIKQKNKFDDRIFYSYMTIEQSDSLLSLQGVNHYVGTEENLDHFQIYGVQWNELGAQWLFNGRVVGQANRKYNQHGLSIDFNGKFPYDYPLSIQLHISENNWYMEENLNREPPILEIDYIRVYGQNELISHFSNKSTIFTSQSKNSSLIIGITSALVVFLVISIILVGFIIQLKRSRNNQNQDINPDKAYELYDYDYVEENVYEDIYYSNRYEIVQANYQINEYLEITPTELDHKLNEQAI